MSKNRVKIMSFFLLGTLLMTSCHREGKGEHIEEPEYTTGAYAEYPLDETLSTTETTEIMPTFSEEIITGTSEYVPPVTEYTPPTTEVFTEETVPEEETILPEETIIPEEQKEEPIIPEQTVNENILVIATTNVNLRSGPTADSIQIDQLKIYDRAYKILTCENGWTLFGITIILDM